MCSLWKSNLLGFLLSTIFLRSGLSDNSEGILELHPLELAKRYFPKIDKKLKGLRFTQVVI